MSETFVTESRWLELIAEQQKIRNENDRLKAELASYLEATEALRRIGDAPRCGTCLRPLSSTTWKSGMVCACV